MARKRVSMHEGPLAELFRATEAAQSRQAAKPGQADQPTPHAPSPDSAPGADPAQTEILQPEHAPTEILSSDWCRGLVSDDPNDLDVTNEAFEVLHFIARKRLAAGKLTVVDATNVQTESRKSLVEIAREFHCLPVAIVLAGGYAQSVEDTITIHANTAAVAKDVLEKVRDGGGWCR